MRQVHLYNLYESELVDRLKALARGVRMPKFSDHFKIGLEQAELDFVDVELDTDTQLYICPYAIQIRDDEWSAGCGDLIRSFFAEVLNQLRSGNQARVNQLLGHLREPNETRLGQSQGRPRGAGVGIDRAALLSDALVRSRAYQTGLLSDISEAELFIHGVGRDTISDLTTNIIRGALGEYTRLQCELFDLPTQVTRRTGPVWVPEQLNWQSVPLHLPHYEDRPILLVPKSTVRYRLSLDSQEFYNHHMVEFLQAEYLHAGGALVEVFKNGSRRVTKKSVKGEHPFVKDELADFVREHPEVLQIYKNLKGAKGPLNNSDLDDHFDERTFAQALINRLEEIPGGDSDADRYHRLCIGIITFIFHPELTNPVREARIHEGRKRVDIIYNNSADSGFFLRRLQAHQTRAQSVFVECKNYTKKIANPELDQLQGRFNLRRGFFGFLMCRAMENRERIIAGCRDTAIDGRGYMMVFEDSDVVHMLQLVRDNQRRQIDDYLERRLLEISL